MKLIKRALALLESVPMTALGGVMLILSLVLSHFSVKVPIDPAWVTVVISGVPLLALAVRRLICNRGISKISSALLISIAMIAAIGIGDLFAAGEVAFIMALGEILEEVTTARAGRGLKKLISLAPTTARRLRDGKEETVSADSVSIGDVLRVLPGETVPVDGVLVAGEGAVDQSVLTGESLPVDKREGDSVYCGTTSCFGAMDVRATRVLEDTSLKKMIHLVREAEEKKAPTARIADRAASYLVPMALLIAVLTGILTRSITRAVTVLVVFCPCALVLATPTAIMAAIGQATRRGVLIKSGEALEKMGKADVVAFDKTGTLTDGILSVSDVIPLKDEMDEKRLLSFAASVEAKSEHPLARAIVKEATNRGIAFPEATAFGMQAGRGVRGRVAEGELLVGSDAYLSENGIHVGKDARERLCTLRAEGKACVLLAVDGATQGVIAFSDTVRKEARETVSALASLGVSSCLLTGDSREAAVHLAHRVGIEAVGAELLPEEKLARVEALEDEGHVSAMVGDGVNDAPALKAASIGIAMGGVGSDISALSADIVLMGDELSSLVYLKRLGVLTGRTIRFGIMLSMLINLLAVALSVLGVLTPTTGALVHNGGSFLVILIAALLYDRKIK